MKNLSRYRLLVEVAIRQSEKIPDNVGQRIKTRFGRENPDIQRVVYERFVNDKMD